MSINKFSCRAPIALATAVAAGLQAVAVHADSTVLGYQFTGLTLNPTTLAANLTGSAFTYVNANPSLPPFTNPPFIAQGGILPDDPPYFIAQGDWFPTSVGANEDYYTFQVSVAPGFVLNASSLSFLANSRQAVLFDSQVAYSTNSNFSSPVNMDTNQFLIPAVNDWFPYSASDAPISNGTGTYYFRVYNQIDPSGSGTISDLLNMGNFSLNGTVQTDSAATNMYWDPSHLGSPGSGGAGTWIGSGNNWADGAIDYAWSNTISEAANFGGAVTGIVSLGGNVSVGGLNFTTGGYTISGSATATLTVAGTITTTADATISAAIATAGAGTVTKAGSGTLTISGATNFASGTSLSITGGTLAISSTSLTLNGANQVVASQASQTATLTVMGTSAFSTDSSLILANQGGNGTLNLQDTATLNAASLIVGKGLPGAGGLGTVNQSGGTLTTATVSLAAGDSTSSGTYNLSGGTLSITSLAGSSGISTFNFNGGILQTTADNISFITGITNLQAQNGGAIIDSNGHNIIIASPIVAGSGSTGGLTKNGAGTLTLSSTPSYTGSTTINNGQLTFQNPNSTFASNTIFASLGTVTNFNLGSNWQINHNITFNGAGTILKTGTGIWTLGNTAISATLSMTGGLIDIEGGEIADGSSNTNFAGNYASLNIATGTTATIDTDDWQVDALTGSGTVRLNAPNAGLSLDVGIAGGSGTFLGAIKQDTGAAGTPLSFIKSGLGTETLTGALTYTGNTTVDAGRLTLLNNTPASSSITIDSGATLEYSDTANLSLVSTTFAGSGTFLKTGAAKLIFGNGTGNVNMALSAGGLIDIEGGQLTGSSSYDGNWTSNLASMSIAAGATFDAVEAGPTSTIQIDSLIGGGTFQGGYFGSAGGISTVTIGAAGGSGTFGGVLRDDAGAHLAVVKTGVGTETFSGANTYTGGTKISGGTLLLNAANSIPDSTVIINPASTLKFAQGIGGVTIQSLSIVSGGKLDLNNDHLFINYAGGADPIASIAAYLLSGYAGGTWSGSGIISTAAQTNSGSYGIGYADSADPGNPAGLPAGTIEIKYTLLGDANLDGKVNGTDFAILATNFNKAVNGWDQGDFNYDGKDNGADFIFVAQNFNRGATQSADLAALDSFAAANGLSADVPEPMAGAMILIAAAGAVARRRRR